MHSPQLSFVSPHHGIVTALSLDLALRIIGDQPARVSHRQTLVLDELIPESKPNAGLIMRNDESAVKHENDLITSVSTAKALQRNQRPSTLVK